MTCRVTNNCTPNGLLPSDIAWRKNPCARACGDRQYCSRTTTRETVLRIGMYRDLALSYLPQCDSNHPRSWQLQLPNFINDPNFWTNFWKYWKYYSFSVPMLERSCIHLSPPHSASKKPLSSLPTFISPLGGVYLLSLSN